MKKTVVITGGSSGIGAATADLFYSEGYNVIVFDLNPCDGRFTYFNVDIRNEDLIENAVSKIDTIDVLVNCAGVYYLRFVTDMPKNELDDIIDTNIKGTFLVSKHCLPKLKESNGNIVNISSGLGMVPELSSPAYCATKAAIIMLTKCMAQEYASIPVRVNCVLPGPIDTPLLRSSFSTEEEYEEYRIINPMKKIGTPDDVAQIIYFLASDKAKYVTGGLYSVDGGESTSSAYSK